MGKCGCEYRVHSLKEYMSVITELADDGDLQNPKVLWFRGMDYDQHPIIPSLYREAKLIRWNKDSEIYSSVKYAEDIRTQHYIAKNYHSYAKLPNSRIEWLEVMQHHEVKTRLLDWSESAIHSLLFAIEPFLSKKFNAQQRKMQFPCVWVLEPMKLNRGILEYFKESASEKFVLEMLNNLSLTKNKKKKMLESLNLFVDFINDSGDECSFASINHLKYIFNLSTINDEIRQMSTNLVYALENREYPIVFYLFKRIYNDGIILNNRHIPPLAVNQPYHSERIKSQRGVFTVFPNYSEKEGDSELRKTGFEPNAMQYNKIAQDCMHKIRIIKPEKIAFEMLSIGMNTSSLYPELPVVSNEIEFHKVY